MSLFDILGAWLGAGAQKKAARQQMASAERISAQQNALLQGQYDQTRADWAPWRETGGRALGRINDFLAPNADLDGLLQREPGYQTSVTQGMNALTGNRAARGALDSGGTIKAAERFGADNANQYLDRILSRYTTAAGLGATGASGTQAAGQFATGGRVNALGALGGSLNSSYGAIGNANASAWGATAAGVGDWFGRGFGK